MAPEDTLEQLPVHSVFLAVGQKIIDLRWQDRHAQPQRPWNALLVVFGAARDAAKKSAWPSRRALSNPEAPLSSTSATIQAAATALAALPWSGNPDPDMAALGCFIERYIAAVPQALVLRHAQDQRVADSFRLETEEELRTYLWRAFAYLAEDCAGKLGNDP